MRPRCVVLPTGRAPALEEAVGRGGGDLVDVGEADALVWVDPDDPEGLRSVLDANPHVCWVQLPWAGIEPYRDVLDDDRRWTCGKGVYAEPVAEHVLALTLGLLRSVGHYSRQQSWTGPRGRNLLGARVTILGGGEITRTLVRLLLPFGCYLTVVRRHADPIDGVAEVLASDRLHEALPTTDVLVLALALTPETEHIVDAAAIAALPDHAVVVNVARGRHIDTDALTTALQEGRLGGAGLDVTDPEPLPDDHPLWTAHNVVITPHVGNTPEMGRVLLAARVAENVARFGRGDPLLGPVDVDLGY
ncbi:D-isomer specific 2-hydroxyacid dehydrogenase family protein [Nitriliruptor alkaliphilus]|uniref:D-isomer specific 2-hydroxyacid dehydrogenase family protein n=1 Tax=Nitriliruptor alkaliphilus TaxID=427918 RepID=UPI000695FC89|nr:D-isomer specific 2-hydroxyacid dehydrogenase family protein [Nitriliruptor alkaliphilus]